MNLKMRMKHLLLLQSCQKITFLSDNSDIFFLSESVIFSFFLGEGIRQLCQRILCRNIEFGIFAVIQSKKEKEIRKKYPGFPKGYWMNQGVGIGIAIGAGIGVALDNIAIGIGIGIAIGAAIGSEREKKHKDEIRPITDEEKKLRKQSIMFMAGILVTGLFIFLAVYLIAK